MDGNTINPVHFAHPIAPAIRERVMGALAMIEARHDVRVLFACESGSRGWGFASPDSDYDVRFVYVHRPDWYLRVASQRDVIELPIDDELDISGWELRKALQLLARANPTLFEWLDSPVVYRAEANWVMQVRALAPAFFSPRKARWHYLAMARKNHREHLRGETVRLKKYLYVLRPLLAAQWVDEGRGMPPMRFAELAEALLDDTALRTELNRLLALKMAAGEAEYGPRFPLIHDWIEMRLARAGDLPDFHQPEGDMAALDDLLLRTVLQR
ncbi:nucleotidyltransferase domain-containing protein [Chitiniphilus purpureus]|uniref:Nucleotidyltransferase domain-containing protein n=1 Tax=Chitiniphilus purpureus TaxID=2981137 RepID=A0ABY6DUC7_9NEIS|nr:nucleotidyltransferase domain-containing protein [Chitiniphilus sp. CD1]UXY15463.1 nucleotidyltransferase domain-containing protein [Chitiniphilus sp. CD1]